MTTRKKIWLIVIGILITVSIIVTYIGWTAYKWIYHSNVSPHIKTYEIILLPTGSTFESMMDTLRSENVLINEKSFRKVAEWKKFGTLIKPGRYRIESGWSNNHLVNHLRLGIQAPVNVTFNNVKTVEQMAGRVAAKLECDSIQIMELLGSKEWLSENLNRDYKSILTFFIPNTYQFNWNTTAEEFITRMKTEHDKFWNEERLNKAKIIGLTPVEVGILASIVQAEQMRFPDERPIIAGLYLNRLRIGMPLQSDPTLIFALGNPSINRVLDRDKEIDSPYNTYKRGGLPPGPILIPEISSIDAVLNPAKDKYLYMCAREDFSGRHYFSKSLAEHNRYAARYRKALNKSKILR